MVSTMSLRIVYYISGGNVLVRLLTSLRSPRLMGSQINANLMMNYAPLGEFFPVI